MSAPGVQRLGSAVLVQGAAIPTLAYLAARGARSCESADGIRIRGPVAELLAALTAASAELSSPGHGDGPQIAIPGELAIGDALLRRVSTREAADRLGVTARQVRRLAPELDGRVSAGRMTVDGDLVAALAAQRSALNS